MHCINCIGIKEKTHLGKQNDTKNLWNIKCAWQSVLWPNHTLARCVFFYQYCLEHKMCLTLCLVWNQLLGEMSLIFLVNSLKVLPGLISLGGLLVATVLKCSKSWHHGQRRIKCTYTTSNSNTIGKKIHTLPLKVWFGHNTDCQAHFMFH